MEVDLGTANNRYDFSMISKTSDCLKPFYIAGDKTRSKSR